MRRFGVCFFDRRLVSVAIAALIAATMVAPGMVSAGAASDAPFHCYLTWQGDPTSTVTVNFHTVDPHTPVEVLFDTVSHDGTPSLYPSTAVASTHVIPGLDGFAGAGRFIHTAELTGLSPGGVYYFIAGSPDGGYTAQRSVRLPGRDLDELRFIDGGDMAVNAFVPPLLQAAAAQSPDFAVLGGDLAYEDGNLANFALWDQWLANWEANMVTPEGHTVPMIVVIGNHEVAGGWGAFANPLASAPFYFGLFAQSGHGFDLPRSAYFRRDVGPDFSLLALDSGHVTPVDGVQSDWIEEQLAQMAGVSLRAAAYHVPMYPSHRSFAEANIADVRGAWLPLFDAGALDLALEHHDHMLKRTKLLRNNQPDTAGTVYLGDGCLGQTPRTGAQAIALEDPANLPALGLTENYLAAWAPARHFWLLEIERDAISGARSLRMTALDANAAVLDESAMGIEMRGDSSDHTGVTCIASAIFARVPGALSDLRRLRDTRLLSSPLGAALSDTYYHLGGPIAAWLATHPRMLEAVQSTTKGVSENLDFSIALIAALALGSAALVSRQRHQSATAAAINRDGSGRTSVLTSQWAERLRGRGRPRH